MQLLILMAGPDDAFTEAGYHYPKNLVEVSGMPIVQAVLNSLEPLRAQCHTIVCAIREDEHRKHHTGAVIRLVEPRATVIPVSATSGAACTALLVIEHLDENEPLVIINGDQILDVDIASIITGFCEKGLDGGIVVFEAVHPRWSYVRCGDDDLVLETAEKRPISNMATAGVYFFARARDFFASAMDMIKKDAHVGGGFYICPVYNEMILGNARIGVARIAKGTYFSLATPMGAQAFEKHQELA